MARSNLGLALGVCLGLTAAARPDGTATPVANAPAPAPTERLIEQTRQHRLQDPRGRRQSWPRAGDALPALKKAAVHPDAEVRQRLTNLIAEIERSILLAPKRITLKLDGVPFAHCRRRTGQGQWLQDRGPGRGGLQPLVNLAVTDMPFWEVFDKLFAPGRPRPATTL